MDDSDPAMLLPSKKLPSLASETATEISLPNSASLEHSDCRLAPPDRPSGDLISNPKKHGNPAASDGQISCGRRRSLSPLKQAIRQHLSSGKQMTRKPSGSFKSPGPLMQQDAAVSGSSDADMSACWLDLPAGIVENSSGFKCCNNTPHPEQNLHVRQISVHITKAGGKWSRSQQKRYRAFRDSPTCIDCCRRGTPQCTTQRCRDCCVAASLTCAYHARSHQRAPIFKEGSKLNLVDRVGT